MKLSSTIIIVALSSGIVGTSYYFARDEQKQHQQLQDEFHKQIIANITGTEGILDDDHKKMFVRYLGQPDAINAGDDLTITPTPLHKTYDVFVGSRKIATVTRDLLEGYYPGREQQP